MAQVLAQPALQRVIEMGIKDLKADNSSKLDIVFSYYNTPQMEASYGQAYIDKIKDWFNKVKVPVTQAWSLNPETAPMVSIHLSNEAEDESKSAIGDFYGMGSDDSDYSDGVDVFKVTLDIGIHGKRNSDEAAWLYYIVKYVLFKYKREAEDLGLTLATFSATDVNRRRDLNPENIYIRWIKYTCITENFWDYDDKITPDGLELDMDIESTDNDNNSVNFEQL